MSSYSGNKKPNEGNQLTKKFDASKINENNVTITVFSCRSITKYQ